jgi:hypothetical protein
MTTGGIAIGFAGYRVAWSPRPISLGATALRHAMRQHPVEAQTIVKALINKMDKICNG